MSVETSGKTTAKPELASEVWIAMLEFFFVKGRPRMLELWREFDLMPPQQMMLGLLDEPQPMGELAKHMHCDNSNITGIVDRLTERGLVERRAAEGDRRVKLVALDRRRPGAARRADPAAVDPARRDRGSIGGRPPQAAARSSSAQWRRPRAIVSAPWRTSAHRAPTSPWPKARRCCSSDGKRLGKVEHVIADLQADIFDGLVIDRSVLPGGHRFIDATQIDQIYERGVVLSVDTAAAERLPEPSQSAAAMKAGGEDLVERDWDDELEAKLKRAWERLSGKAP